MSSSRQYLSERYPWLTLTDSLAVAFVLVLAIVAIWPHAHLASDIVLITAIPGIVAAVMWGLTFWSKARVQFGRRKLRYKSVRRVAGLAAVFCLPFLLLQQTSIYLRGPNILRVTPLDPTGLSEPYPKLAKWEIRVVVAIAHLEGDDGHKIEGRLRDALANLDPRLHVTPVILNRMIKVSGRPQGAAHLEALTSVTDARVESLIWVLAGAFGIDAILGAFAAGMVVGLATRGKDGHLVREKIDAIAFGYFVPFFSSPAGCASTSARCAKAPSASC